MRQALVDGRRELADAHVVLQEDHLHARARASLFPPPPLLLLSLSHTHTRTLCAKGRGEGAGRGGSVSDGGDGPHKPSDRCLPSHSAVGRKEGHTTGARRVKAELEGST